MPSLGVRSPWVYLSQFSRTLEKVRIALPLGSVTLATVADGNFDVKLNFLVCTPSNSSISLAQSSFSPVQLGIIPSRSFKSGLISKGILTLVPLPTKGVKSLP